MDENLIRRQGSQRLLRAASAIRSGLKAATAIRAGLKVNELSMEYPLYAMRMSDFLSMTELHTHNTLRHRGIVVPLDFAGEHAGAQINFVSHQWLGFEVADPELAHLHTLQDTFTRVIAGESIFKSVADEEAYHRRVDNDNLAAVGGRAADVAESSDRFRRSVADGWVWMDFVSIPQTIGLEHEDEVRAALADQAKAIRSIPAYVGHACNFWVCAPAGVTHKGSGATCDLASWKRRGVRDCLSNPAPPTLPALAVLTLPALAVLTLPALTMLTSRARSLVPGSLQWCRMEESALAICQLAFVRPIMLTHELGKPPAATSLDLVDRTAVELQRRSAVLTGEFACCRMQHRIASADGHVTPIPCDRDQLRKVLRKLFDAHVSSLRADFEADPMVQQSVAEVGLRATLHRGLATASCRMPSTTTTTLCCSSRTSSPSPATQPTRRDSGASRAWGTRPRLTSTRFSGATRARTLRRCGLSRMLTLACSCSTLL